METENKIASKNTKDIILEGVVERVVFRNDTNGWTVLRLKNPDKQILDTVVGSFQELYSGENVRFSGQWVKDKMHGKQFKAKTCLPLVPATVKGIEKFLGSGLISGIGQVMAKRIVDKFGIDTLEIIEKYPSRLAEIEGIGKNRAEAISSGLAEKREIKNVMVFLESIGISPAYAHRIFKKYANRAIQVVSDNPYKLASEVSGIGFKMADKIAAELGIPKDSKDRAEAGLLYALLEFAKEGHVFAPEDALLVKGEELLDIDYHSLKQAVERLKLSGRVIPSGNSSDCPIYLPDLEKAERDAAKHIKRLINSKPRSLSYDPEVIIKMVEDSTNMEFAPQQKEAFYALKSSKIMVVTGGPGTGKTTLLKGLIATFKKDRHSIILAAPTGRAAKRMSESTKREASTLHRLLEYTPKTGQFAKDETDPLKADVIIVDEVSMVDIELFCSLLRAVPDRARLILVGDPDQLPSVGPGTVLSDLLTLGKRLSPALEVVRLTEIFRQARSSLIITGAHDILNGKLPNMGKKGSASDLFMIEREDPDECLEIIKKMVKTRIPEAFGMDPVKDIQVLTPMHKGILGAENLNRELQELLNPKAQTGTELLKARDFRTGDKVMQVRNNYDLEVFNGDMGIVIGIGEDDNYIKIDYGIKTVSYPVSELDQITLAYATSIHKSQGSEYPAVIIPVHTQHFIMLARNLIYTGITRGKKLVVLVGSQRALKIAVKNDEHAFRNSGLTYRTIE
ncbi:MAG: ATP-dependent RecD-like DNA helicase [Deltaproteobacteria bacterium]|nr:ATP-dependent RecD-like DNA helicase [Deltaproteobacteria bacterium]